MEDISDTYKQIVEFQYLGDKVKKPPEEVPHEFYELLMREPECCQSMYQYANWISCENGTEKEIFDSDNQDTTQMSVYTFNMVNWFLARHAGIQTLFDSRTGIYEKCMPIHARQIGKAVLSLVYRTPELSEMLRPSFMEHNTTRGFWKLDGPTTQRSSYAELLWFAEFCLRSSGFMIYPEYRKQT